jgi:hypothetical protein
MFDLLIVDGNNRARAAHSHQDGLVADTFFGDIKQGGGFGHDLLLLKWKMKVK